MNCLVQLLKETAKSVDKCDSEVKTGALKCKLQRDFPQPNFLRQKQHNTSEIVLYEGAALDVVVPAADGNISVETNSSNEDTASSVESEGEEEMNHTSDKLE